MSTTTRIRSITRNSWMVLAIPMLLMTFAQPLSGQGNDKPALLVFAEGTFGDNCLFGGGFDFQCTFLTFGDQKAAFTVTGSFNSQDTYVASWTYVSKHGGFHAEVDGDVVAPQTVIEVGIVTHVFGDLQRMIEVGDPVRAEIDQPAPDISAVVTVGD